jgi:hypothetical protein
MCVACLSAILDSFYTITTIVVSHSILSHSALYIYVCLDYVGTRYCIGKYTVQVNARAAYYNPLAHKQIPPLPSR